jgi:sulfite reductase (NADPH) flavoprotein alpha-component
MRRLHSIAGLAGALILVFMALTGAILSVQPAVETITAGGGGTTVAQLAAAVSSELPGVERITHSASGTVVAYYKDAGAYQAAQIDPASGAVLGPYEPSPFFTFVSELHRSLFFGEAGRATAGIASLVIAVLAATGILMIVKRMGGWRKLFTGVRGSGMSRLHAQLGRLAVVGLVITSLSGAWMSGVYFELVPDGSSLSFALPPASSGDAPAAIDTLTALASTPLSDLRELLLPSAGDTGDVFTLTTASGQGYVDQATGEMLSFTANTFWQQFYETIYLLHTGQGAWWLGLILGVVALAVPAMAVSGVAIWLRERRNNVKLPANASWTRARTVILVGSENGSTMGFAAALHRELVAHGELVHTAPMSTVRYYPRAERLLVLTATYGEGQAPASAKTFLSRLARLDRAPAPSFAVLGFGDRSFPQFCGYANQVNAALAETGSSPILQLATVDRQSGQDFAAWGHALGDTDGEPLELAYAPPPPRTRQLQLVDREDFGVEVQAPTSILRFSAAPSTRSLLDRLMGRPARLPSYRVGDLVGIVPPGSIVPRYYSLASSAKEGVLEICVRKQTGGVSSAYLHGLVPGAVVEGFIRANPDFRPARRRPLILIGAGTGVAPLAGFIRNNTPGRPTYLFFGARDPQSDFLYREQLEDALGDGRLTGLSMAFSRIVGGGYVQDSVAMEADALRQLIAQGAQILVCGGLDMARGVRSALDAVLTPVGLSIDTLKAQGRYLEDAY